jgi:hypothetical protein
MKRETNNVGNLDKGVPLGKSIDSAKPIYVVAFALIS